jgi:hypothetical protein
MSKGRRPEGGGSNEPTEPVKAEETPREMAARAAKAPRVKVKSRKPKRHLAPRITVEQYNELQKSYFTSQNITAAATAAGVGYKTAKFYIEGEGRPDIGFTPIKQSWLDVQVEAQERRQITLVSFHEKQTKELEEIIGTSIAELKLIRAEVFRRVNRYKDSGGKDIETGATMGRALMTYEKAVKLMERLLGAPDATLEHRGEDRYKNWSDEEIIEFMATGLVPDHAR